MTIENVQRETYTTPEVCKMFGIDKVTVYKLIRNDKLHPLSIKKNPFLFSKKEVDSILEYNK